MLVGRQEFRSKRSSGYKEKDVLWLEEMDASSQKGLVAVFPDQSSSQWP